MALSLMGPLALPAAAWPALPCFLALLSCAALGFAKTRPLLALLIPALLTSSVVGPRLDDRLAPAEAGRAFIVEGVITDLPSRRGNLTEFHLRVEKPELGPSLPRRFRVRWYRDAPALRPGQRWRLSLKLQPPRGRVNFSGADPEQRLFAQGVGALASVTAGPRRLLDRTHGGLHGFRFDLGTTLATAMAGQPAAGIVMALATGDRSALSDLQRRTLNATGTGHLLAISGLHVGLAALAGFHASRLLTWLLPLRWQLRRGRALRWAAALISALAYSALAGFGVSTRRALLMLGVLAAARLGKRHSGLFAPWSLALVACLVIAPLSPLLPGFWLSFLAVGTLLWRFGPRPTRSRRVLRLAFAQLSITLVMAPLSLYWFQDAAVAGLAANLFAIPWVSLLTVPLVFAGLLSIIAGLPQLAAAVLAGATASVDLLFALLAPLADLPLAWPASGVQPSFLAALLAALGGLVLLVPRPLGLSVLATALMLPVWFPWPARLPAGHLQLDLLDVGQGLSALVVTRERLLLYDTGPGEAGQWDLADAVIVPAVRHGGFRSPDLIVVGHGDSDHAGGLASVRAAFPATPTAANLGQAAPGVVACDTRRHWAWPGLSIEVLHPTPWLPYLGNASSCVLSVNTGPGAILLPGDIDAAVESRLVEEGLAPHDLVVVPHHGSQTSSGAPFVSALAARAALIAAGAGNRFGFPRREVVDRYRAGGARVMAVSDCGAIRVRLDPHGRASVISARNARPGLWRWPAAASCP